MIIYASMTILAKKDDFIEVTEWTNGEGWDITINDKVIPLTRGEFGCY